MSDTSNDHVILVDENDHEIGTAEKLQAHKDGCLHRAISVFVTHDKDILLQQRADGKYHSAGLWSNTCCSHPRPGEPTLAAAQRRLEEEMGIQCPLKFAGSFIYRACLENGLTEHELDHVFTGVLVDRNNFTINPAEAKSAKWISREDLKHNLKQHPENHTSWLKQAAITAHLL